MRCSRESGAQQTDTAELPFGALTEERLALVACALGQPQAQALMEGLIPKRRALAQGAVAQAQAMSSGERQAKLAVLFGVRSDADSRLGRAMADAGPLLRRAIFAKLPPYLRSLFPSLSAEGPEEIPGVVKAWAERLVREATG